MFRTTPFKAALAAATLMTAASAMADTGDRSTHFNGLYIGAGGGFDAQPADNRNDVVFDNNGDGKFDNTVVTGTGANAFAPGFCSGYPNGGSRLAADGCKGDKDRGEFFARVGYDRRMGNFVVGAVLEGAKTYAVDRTTAFSSTPHFYNFQRGIDWMGAARLRAGYTPNGGVLFYATGGGVYARMDHEFSTSNTTSSFVQNGKNDAWGYQVGGGLEAMVMKNISVGMEYLYTDINDDKYYVTATGGPFGAGTNMRPGDQGFKYHAIRGTVAFRF